MCDSIYKKWNDKICDNSDNSSLLFSVCLVYNNIIALHSYRKGWIIITLIYSVCVDEWLLCVYAVC